MWVWAGSRASSPGEAAAFQKSGGAEAELGVETLEP